LLTAGMDFFVIPGTQRTAEIS